MYLNFLSSLSKKIESKFSEMEAIYNFDNGPEFEIAVCIIISELLPYKFGVCRGFIIDCNEWVAGDDIIIYDRLRFPTIRSLNEGDFSRKEQVPFEAVYCYIEAKHNLELDENDGTLIDALNQIQKIKSLKRPSRSLSQITELCNLNTRSPPEPPNESWADKYNPLYTCIISRKTSLKKKYDKNLKKGPLDVDSTYRLLHRQMSIEKIPDLLVAGNGVICVPTFKERQHLMPFNEPNQGSGFCTFKTKYNALAIGLCHLLWALDRIQLGVMPWEDIIVSGLN